ncbi:hypothetical protein DYBT9275_03970 [Dyadobacter sp. CECT 9275]|uniref:Cytochrome c domain-containing protein n=1 Tax=Dyadobacter helix TaxID=2822344 RepID=A0A916JII0_9BACT|nr:PVC-type heme-binding CxxCH protein [Dyadobacter sp. CECT 9275]CAG5007133.1 hypothetical protein DYBT9275_03970 [Dyadobacter sp. CECT 9275]
MKAIFPGHKRASLFYTIVLLLYTQSCSVPKKQATVQQPVAKDKFAEHIRTTEWQSPEQERLGFKLPPGFEITLFASEPEITKPINMEFDDRGRLWVTQSSEYPVAAGNSDGRDRITILEDKNEDGKADTFTNFADDLNIPIGVMPVADGAIAYSIPNLYHFTDANNDGKADNRSILLGPFGYKDTHGMVNNLMRGYDGWLHVCHGFSNTSHVAGTDGDTIRMVSGNTFRVKMDGSHVEQTTFGRVNPFGYAYDEKGYLYSVDCHTKPITQLIAGGDYPHFGKKAPVGLGFAPEMMSYDLGSTALAGLVYYTGTHFPALYRNSFYTGDVVTCRIDRNTIFHNGSTPVAKKEDPFLLSSDPWFRPVDVKQGPDGALYIADFYNRIIGHYEVALNHPGRDRISGRIWKITYKGDQAHKDIPVTDWSKASIQQLVDGLAHPQLNTRLKVADRLVDMWKSRAIDPVKTMMSASKTTPTPYSHGLWVLHRLNALDDVTLNQALQSSDPVIKIHAFRILLERPVLEVPYHDLTLTALSDKDPNIRRVAAEILTHFPDAANLKGLMALYDKTEQSDSHLKYTAILGIRNNLRNSSVMWRIPGMKWDEHELELLTRVMLDVPSPAAASMVLDYVRTHDMPSRELVNSLEYISRYASPYQLETVIDLVNAKFPADLETQLTLYKTVKAGVLQSGAKPGRKMTDWGEKLATGILVDITESGDTWKSRPVVRTGEQANPWMVSEKLLTDVMPAFRVMVSEKGGNPPKAALYSTPFKLPASLSMNIFDTDVFNSASKKGTSNNVVRIKLAQTGKVISEYRGKYTEPMQRKDLIRNTTFDLRVYEGQMGYIETLDSSQAGAVGIGKLEPAVIAIPEKGPSVWTEQRATAAEIAGEYKIAALQPVLQQIVKAPWMDYKVRSAAANALMSINPKTNAGILGAVFSDPAELPALREKLAIALGQETTGSVFEILKNSLAGGARNLQIAVAAVLASTSEGLDYLLSAFKEEEINADIANEIPVKEKISINATSEQQSRVDKILAAGSNEREERQKLIDARVAGYQPANLPTGTGKAIFVQNCSSCHQIQGAGGLIGPQLDGIGNWGPKALTQKILDPNRNITEAFRTYNITLKDDKQLSGLYRRTEGEALVFADLTGQEFTIAKNNIKEYRPSKYTLMPDQFRNTIPEKEFYALLEYLLGVK